MAIFIYSMDLSLLYKDMDIIGFFGFCSTV